MIYGNDRSTLRLTFFNAWQKKQDQQVLEPLESLIVDIAEMHPEYHDLLNNKDTNIDADFGADTGASNPFLHMAMHISIKEQISIDQPPGIRALHHTLMTQYQDPHRTEHEIMECLGEVLWSAQRAGQEPDQAQYLSCVKKLIKN